MNPFNERPMPLEKTIMDWRQLAPIPYDKYSVDPYTRTRVILMNGTEFEAVWFSHQFSRHCTDNDLRRELAMIRRSEQQQQKLVSALKPADETVLEHTIGFEQIAVDLTAALAQRESNGNVKNALSNLSIIPPCPGKIFPKSFIPVLLLITEQNQSPS
jgi:hypothetical protein